MAVARSAAAARDHGDYDHIVRWYRESLPNVAPPTWSRWEPIRIGPSWDWNESRGWLFPEHSMGWDVLGWCGRWLRDGRGNEWQFTPEQARFILWFHAVDGDGRLLYRTAVLQRMKGWGKDPLAATLLMAHAFAPTAFDGWDEGQPVGRENENAWAQITAVSKEQTANTMKLFPSLISQDCRDRYKIQIGRENVWGCGDTRQIQATSSNPLSLEGNRVDFAIRNEPQNWNASNQGHDLAGVIDGNSTKIPDGIGRVLDIENAFRPGEDSVAERVRDAWEATQATEHRGAKALSFGMLYDSLEAHPEAPLTADGAPEVLETIRGDSVWLDIPSITQSILNGSNTPSESRRKWYNQITASADSWISPQEWDACYRDEVVNDGDKIVAFFDGSKSDDHTALIGCRISDGFMFPVGIWLPDRHTNLVDRERVDFDVRQMFSRFDVVGLWADVYGAKDDETGAGYWESYADGWAREFRRPLSRLPAVKTGMQMHLVNWDMRDSNGPHQKAFTEAVGRFLTDVTDQTLFHNTPANAAQGGLGVLLRQHVLNARRRPNRFGITIGKEHRESRKKVDAAVCAVGARMMWTFYRQQNPKGRQPGGGRVITYK